MENFLLKLRSPLRKWVIYVAPLDARQTNKDAQWMAFRGALRVEEKELEESVQRERIDT